jgi:hypothetical protein
MGENAGKLSIVAATLLENDGELAMIGVQLKVMQSRIMLMEVGV